MEQIVHDPQTCQSIANSVQDALYVLNGKWKLPVIAVLRDGPRRFREIERAIPGITPKVLSKELRLLELNEFVVRQVQSTVPVQVTYELTPYSDSLKEIIGALSTWGEQHKHIILEARRKDTAERRRNGETEPDL